MYQFIPPPRLLPSLPVDSAFLRACARVQGCVTDGMVAVDWLVGWCLFSGSFLPIPVLFHIFYFFFQSSEYVLYCTYILPISSIKFLRLLHECNVPQGDKLQYTQNFYTTTKDWNVSETCRLFKVILLSLDQYIFCQDVYKKTQYSVNFRCL